MSTNIYEACLASIIWQVLVMLAWMVWSYHWLGHSLVGESHNVSRNVGSTLKVKHKGTSNLASGRPDKWHLGLPQCEEGCLLVMEYFFMYLAPIYQNEKILLLLYCTYFLWLRSMVLIPHTGKWLSFSIPFKHS